MPRIAVGVLSEPARSRVCVCGCVCVCVGVGVCGCVCVWVSGGSSLCSLSWSQRKALASPVPGPPPSSFHGHHPPCPGHACLPVGPRPPLPHSLPSPRSFPCLSPPGSAHLTIAGASTTGRLCSSGGILDYFVRGFANHMDDPLS